MGRHQGLAAAALVAMAVLVGCDGDPPPQSTTPPRTSQTTTSASPSAQAPPVTQPLDATRFRADPCGSLTESQRHTLTLASGSIDPDRTGKSCNFATADKGIIVTVSYDANSVTRIGEKTTGLSTVYEQRSRGLWEYWEPIALDGYPAVIYEASVAKTKFGCELAVGISDSSFFDVRHAIWPGGPEVKDTCAAARAVASAVLSTIKAGK